MQKNITGNIKSFFKVLKKHFNKDVVFRFSVIYSIFSFLEILYHNIITYGAFHNHFPHLYYLLYYTLGLLWCYLFFRFMLVLHKYLFLVTSFIFTFVSVIWYYFHFTFHTTLNSSILYAVFNPTKEQGHAFAALDFFFYFYVLFSCAVWVWSVYPLFKRKYSFAIKQFYTFLSLFFVLLFFNFYDHIILVAPPFNFLNTLGDYITLNHNLNSPNIFSSIDLSNTVMHNKKPVLTVMYLGESQRADHLEINGYKRATTPLLAKENLINFGIIKSSGTSTNDAVPYLLTSINFSDDYLKALKQKAITNIFTSHNFDTYYIGTVHNPFTDVWNKGEKKIMLDYYFGYHAGALHVNELKEGNFNYDLPQAFDDFIKKNYKNNKPTFVLLRNEGSHINYINQYPQSAAKFNPAISDWNIQSVPKNEFYKVVNAYDNTIVYFDTELNNIIQKVKAKKVPALVFYTSDHGESLGEGGNYIHSNPAIEVRMTSLLIWVSDEYKREYPEKYKALLANVKVYKNRITQNVVWHSLLDASGFNNKNDDSPIKKEYSVFNKNLKPELNADWFKVDYKRN